MTRARFTPLIASAIVFAIGLVLGAGKAESDTSIANTASKVLLTVGFVAVLVSLVVLVVARVRSGATPPPGGGGSGRSPRPGSEP